MSWSQGLCSAGCCDGEGNIYEGGRDGPRRGQGGEYGYVCERGLEFGEGCIQGGREAVILVQLALKGLKTSVLAVLN